MLLSTVTEMINDSEDKLEISQLEQIEYKHKIATKYESHSAAGEDLTC